VLGWLASAAEGLKSGKMERLKAVTLRDLSVTYLETLKEARSAGCVEVMTSKGVLRLSGAREAVAAVEVAVAEVRATSSGGAEEKRVSLFSAEPVGSDTPDLSGAADEGLNQISPETR
jgi:hypothetical protein